MEKLIRIWEDRCRNKEIPKVSKSYSSTELLSTEQMDIMVDHTKEWIKVMADQYVHDKKNLSYWICEYATPVDKDLFLFEFDEEPPLIICQAGFQINFRTKFNRLKVRKLAKRFATAFHNAYFSTYEGIHVKLRNYFVVFGSEIMRIHHSEFIRLTKLYKEGRDTYQAFRLEQIQKANLIKD